jgi:tetratricopeptide (TPR) repeat protein
MRRSLLFALTFAATSAFACGPDFPEVLLGTRQATLADLPEGTFMLEVTRLAPKPAFAFAPAERADWIYSEPAPPDRDAVERAMLGADYDRADAIRRRIDAKIAYAAGEGFPEDARRYLAGAAAYAHDDNAEAERRFESVLALPPAERPRYGVWAAYMIGRIEEAGADTDSAKAEKAFQTVRELVAAGAADPLGLAVDSYGEEARIHLENGDDNGAIALYAQQAALGSRFAGPSLLEVARAIVRNPKRLANAIEAPMTQRLVAIYLATRSGEFGSDYEDTSGASAPQAKRAIDTFLDAVEKRGLDHVEGAGELAVLAYRTGRYDLAAKFASKGSDGDAAWVRAKLALRDGNPDAAATAYAEASKAFPVVDRSAPTWDEWSDTPSDFCRVEGEAGTLALARNEYVSALEHLYAASPTFWMDAAFVAERVLTLDELVAFTAKHAPNAIATTKPDEAISETQRRDGSLRALLARRLLRADRFDEAFAYFDDALLKQKARDYANALRAATSGGRIERATQWWNAAKRAREDGMELLGYELDPDAAFFGGSFEIFTTFGYGPTRDERELAAMGGTGEDPGRSAPPLPVLKVDAGPSDGEKTRVAASAANPDRRFHYRYVAGDLAQHAADLVPSRSQAYAAMLCQATGWILYRDPKRARALYDVYVKNGPYVPWAEDFGNQCEEPDFDGAAARLHVERVRYAKHVVRVAAPLVAGAIVVAAIVAFLLVRRRRATPG